MDPHMSNIATLAPDVQKDLDMCFMLESLKFTGVWQIIWFFCKYSDLISPSASLPLSLYLS